MEVEQAYRFLAGSSSRCISLALAWWREREDPVDLLFVLSREVGPAIGPWETFRLCALLGLTPAPAVRELGLDILAEPFAPTARLRPPVSEAFALAHALRMWPTEPAPSVAATLTHLRAVCAPPAAMTASSFAVIAARVALSQAAAARGALDLAADQELERLERYLHLGPVPPAGLPEREGLPELAEALSFCTAEFRQDHGLRLQRLLRAGQREDGGLWEGQPSRRRREWTTLRALAALGGWSSGGRGARGAQDGQPQHGQPQHGG